MSRPLGAIERHGHTDLPLRYGGNSGGRRPGLGQPPSWQRPAVSGRRGLLPGRPRHRLRGGPVVIVLDRIGRPLARLGGLRELLDAHGLAQLPALLRRGGGQCFAEASGVSKRGFEILGGETFWNVALVT